MKNKSKLSQLKVSSFVTSLEGSKEHTVQGGAGDPLPIDTGGSVLTVVTFGYWSWCCPGGTGDPA